jgi:hypothetical protein
MADLRAALDASTEVGDDLVRRVVMLESTVAALNAQRIVSPIYPPIYPPDPYYTSPWSLGFIPYGVVVGVDYAEGMGPKVEGEE